MNMKNRSRLVMVIVCSACFAIIWGMYSSGLTFEAWGGIVEVPVGDRYNKSVKPFLTIDGNLSLKTFIWWKSLQRERGNLKQFKVAKERLFKIFPSRPVVTERHPDRCQTCAVVGNSGNLIGTHYGRQIDTNDIVIRMNFGKTAGYEGDVGTKTTHRVMYPESAMDLDNNTHLVLFPFKILDLQWIAEAFTTGVHGRSYAPVKTKIKANKNLVLVVNPGFMKYVHTSWLLNRGRYPSTGFMTLVLAMHICDEVNVFGFGADKNGNWNHYWEVLHDKHLKTGVHPGTYEYNLIQELAKQNKVTFNRG
ncbi:CMP-N-acetylneuraminate-beta-galactosamide-alpha-2,3-sialyltransferase 1-like [Eucyclogobius newberryi]|uniref:CMP-N-acetylneuraminate-beta-galactosamide- alpha-2,3-sialyltransferase 1-like n=1 Tax=Eucyclogobius newberryi TaxID=166745 RepID=UPI003B5CE4A5